MCFKISEIMKLKPLISLFLDIVFADGSQKWDLLLTAMLPFCQAMMEKVLLACRAVSEQSYLCLYPPTSDSSQTNSFTWQLMDFYYIFSQHNLFQIPASLSCLSGPVLHLAPALSYMGWICPAATSRFVKSFGQILLTCWSHSILLIQTF